MVEAFKKLSPEAKRAERFNAWLAAEGIDFISPQARDNYQQRVQRFIDVIQLRKPDRVPVMPNVSLFPALNAGMTVAEAMYDYAKVAAAWQKYTFEFEPDAAPTTFAPGSGKVLEILDYKLFRWPNHGVGPNTPYQYVESEYMQADEYDELIADPSAFLMHKYLGRICGKLEPLQKLPSLFHSLEFPTFLGAMVTLGDPAIQEALNTIMKAAGEAAQWSAIAKASDSKIRAHGFPALGSGFTKAPFDNIGDTLRGTVGVIKDMYRQPEKLLKAVDQITPIMLQMGISVPLGASPIVMMPLHKGADGFMSDAQFKKFYWPGLKAVIMGMIEEGLVPCLFAEGGYSSRLDIIKELPPGKTVWFFDRMDMGKAKAVLGNVACLMGNVQSSLLSSGSTEDVRKYCQELIDVAGKDGGFILSTGTVIDSAKPENLKAMIDTAKTGGRY